MSSPLVIAGNVAHRREQNFTGETWNEDLDLPLFGFDVIAEATNNFSLANTIGEGGFGTVYKVQHKGNCKQLAFETTMTFFLGQHM